MYSPTLPYYHSYKMDYVTAHYVQLRVQVESTESESNPNEKEPYKSPTRNIMCSQCGQQYHWCNCNLKEKEEDNKE